MDREALRASVPSFLRGRRAAEDAYDLAARFHAGQRRDVDGCPFLVHPLKVASLLDALGAPEPAIVAAILHDLLENTDATADDVRSVAGEQVAAVVQELSEDEAVADYEERKAALRAAVAGGSEMAVVVFAADKVAKVRETRHEPPGQERERRLEHHRACLHVVEQRLGDHPLTELLRFELEMLQPPFWTAAPEHPA